MRRASAWYLPPVSLAFSGSFSWTEALGRLALQVRTHREAVGMKKGEKKFDAVKTMREIRDRLSEDFKGMTFDEEKQYIRRRIKVRPKTAPRAKTGRDAA